MTGVKRSLGMTGVKHSLGMTGLMLEVTHAGAEHGDAALV